MFLTLSTTSSDSTTEMGRHPEASSSSAAPDLVVSNSRLSLSLAAPHGGSFVAGSTIHPELQIKGDPHYTELNMYLIGQTSAVLMGKARWASRTMRSLHAKLGR